MKFLAVYRFLLIVALALISTLASVNAAQAAIEQPVLRVMEETFLTMYQDSTAAKKKSSNKPKEVQKPSQDDQRIEETQRRAIKQVPRSIPKLKPQPVNGRGKVSRPPMKVPKKGMKGPKF